MEFNACNIDAALCILEDCRIHQDNWGIEKMNMVLAQAVTYALRCLTEELPSNRYNDEITDLCTYLWKLSRRVPIAIALLRTIQLDTQLQGKTLPAKAQYLVQSISASRSATLEELNRDARDSFSAYPQLLSRIN